jgi:type I restriction enzyme, S subunit
VRLCTDRCADPVAEGIERYVGLEHLEPNDLRIRSWGLVANGVTFTTRFKSGQVLFGKRRAYQRKVAIAEFAGVCSGDIYVFEPSSGRLLPGLLPYVCQSEAFFEHALKTSAGSLSPRTNWNSLADFEFAIAPLDEQQRLVAALTTRSTALEAHRELRRTLDVARSALVEAWIQDSGRSARLARLGDVSDIAYGLTVDATRRTLREQRPYLRVANVQRGALDLSEVKSIGFDQSDSKCVLKPNDVLVVEGHASATEIGRAAQWNDEVPGALHQNHLIRVRAGGQLDPEYVTIALNSSLGRKHFQAAAKSTSGLYTINSSVVKAFMIPLESLPAQRQLVASFNALSRAADASASRRSKLAEWELLHVQ